MYMYMPVGVSAGSTVVSFRQNWIMILSLVTFQQFSQYQTNTYNTNTSLFRVEFGNTNTRAENGTHENTRVTKICQNG